LALRAAAQDKLNTANARYEVFRQQQVKDIAIQTGLKETQREIILHEQRRLQVAGLVADARRLYDAAQFKEAAALLTQATVIDPQDENAQLLLRLVQDKIVAARTKTSSIALVRK